MKAGEIRAIIGPNGEGKSTLLNLLAGTLAPSVGKILLGTEDITRLSVHERARRGISRSYQVVKLFEGLTCREVLQLAIQRDLSLRDWFTSGGTAEIIRRADLALEAAGLSEVAQQEIHPHFARPAKASRDRIGAGNRVPGCCCSTSRWPA